MCYNKDGDDMKRYSLFLFVIGLFFFGITVNAKSVSLEDVVEVINSGDITKEFRKDKLSEKDPDTGKKLWKEVEIKASAINNQVYIQFTYSNDDNVMYSTVVANVLEDGLTLQSNIEYSDKDSEENLKIIRYKIELHDLLPLGEVDASGEWKEIKKYVSGSYINKLNTIFDRCYRKEMHLCRTSVNSYDNHVYTSDVELNEKAALYALSVLKEEKKAADNDRLMAMLAVAAVVLVIIILLLKSKEPKPQIMKY